jgi:hypothetical protein
MPFNAPKTHLTELNLKSEIEISNLQQSLGYKRIEKISPDRFGYGFDFFDSFLLQHLATSWPFNLGFQVKAHCWELWK